MNRASLLGFVLALPALGAAFFACQKEDPRPAVSDGPGVFNPNTGSGSTTDGGTTADGGSDFTSVSFAGLIPTGVAANGDSAIVTLRPAPTNSAASGEIVSVALDGSVKVLLPSAKGPATPVVAKGILYFTDAPSGNNFIESLDLADPSAGAKLLLQADAASLVVVGDKLYYAAGFGGAGIEIGSIPLTGGSPTSITTDPTSAAATGVAVDDTNCYFAAGDHIGVAPLTGGPPDSLATGPITTVGPILVANATVYYVDNFATDEISSTPTSGSGKTTLVPGLTRVTDLHIADDYFYFTDANGLERAPIVVDGGSLSQQVLGILAGAQGLAVGTTSIFAFNEDAVFRAQR